MARRSIVVFGTLLALAISVGVQARSVVVLPRMVDGVWSGYELPRRLVPVTMVLDKDKMVFVDSQYVYFGDFKKTLPSIGTDGAHHHDVDVTLTRVLTLVGLDVSQKLKLPLKMLGKASIDKKHLHFCAAEPGARVRPTSSKKPGARDRCYTLSHFPTKVLPTKPTSN